MDCDVCQKEESKSKTLELNKSKILQKEIIPSNQCWICNLTFQDGGTQVQHFINEHECTLCGKLFDDVALKKKHFSLEHVCDHCEEVFVHIVEKVRHIEQIHKEQWPALERKLMAVNLDITQIKKFQV